MLLVAYAIFAETSITFLGLGDPSLISWGRLIENAFTDDALLNDAWWAIVPPGVCVAIVVLACTMVGQAIEDSLNPRLSVGHLSVRRFRLRPVAEARAMSRARAVSRAARLVRRSPAAASCTPSAGIDFSRRRGRAVRARRRVGLRQDDGDPRADGLLPPNASVAGQVLLDGEDILARGEESVRPHRWSDIAMVFQGAMNAFNPVQTIGDQIVEPMELHDVAEGKAAMRRARELLEVVGIPGDRVARYPHEFSGGMRQRAAIAMALACKPKVLLADEPTTALDVMVQAQILELLTALSNDLGLALVLVTHDLPDRRAGLRPRRR